MLMLVVLRMLMMMPRMIILSGGLLVVVRPIPTSCSLEQNMATFDKMELNQTQPMLLGPGP